MSIFLLSFTLIDVGGNKTQNKRKERLPDHKEETRIVKIKDLERKRGDGLKSFDSERLR